MSQPNFFSEGSSPRRPDTLWKIEQKILGALADGAAAIGGGGAIPPGAVDPEGVVIGNPGQTYWNTSVFPHTEWLKETGTGTTTGWVQVV